MAAAERLRLRIADTPIQAPGGRSVQVTASFGVTASIRGDTSSVLLKRADQALYAAKREGRNRVVPGLAIEAAAERAPAAVHAL
jgi:diguanylate cyclase (GGDEF)-like protein